MTEKYLLDFKDKANKSYKLLSEMLDLWYKDANDKNYIDDTIDDYPFNHSFDEVVSSFGTWVSEINEKIK